MIVSCLHRISYVAQTICVLLLFMNALSLRSKLDLSPSLLPKHPASRLRHGLSQSNSIHSPLKASSFFPSFPTRRTMIPSIYKKTRLASSTSLQGFESFVRTNPMSDKFNSSSFHHIEFYCGDATITSRRFMFGLGMELVAKSDQSTGNTVHASYVTQSGQMRMIFTAPYLSTTQTSSSSSPSSSPSPSSSSSSSTSSSITNPGFKSDDAVSFCMKHGLGVRAIAIEVQNVPHAYATLLSGGGKGVLEPCQVYDMDNSKGHVELAEVSLYGDVVLRLLDTKKYTGEFLPNFSAVKSTVSSSSSSSTRKKENEEEEGGSK